MKNTIITIASLSALAGAAHAQVAPKSGLITSPIGATYSSAFYSENVPSGNAGVGASQTAIITLGSAIDINDLALEVGQNISDVIVSFTFVSGGSVSAFSLSNIDLPDVATRTYTTDGVFDLGTMTLVGSGSDQIQNDLAFLQFAGTGDVASISFTGGAASESVQIFAGSVPEPSSTALLGLGGLALILRRKK